MAVGSGVLGVKVGEELVVGAAVGFDGAADGMAVGSAVLGESVGAVDGTGVVGLGVTILSLAESKATCTFVRLSSCVSAAFDDSVSSCSSSLASGKVSMKGASICSAV